MQHYLKMFQPVLPLLFIFVGLMVGVIVEKIIFLKLHKFSVKAKWEGDEMIIGALRGIAIFWFIVAGAYVALLMLPLTNPVLNLLQKILLAAAIFSATMFLAKVAGGFLNLYLKRKEETLPSTSIFVNITKLFIFLLGVLIILQSLGISITPVLTALGVGGLAVALALQDTLSNLFSGLYLIMSKQIKPGDYIKLDAGDEGYVVDVTWRNTTIRALANNMIVVPNHKLAAAIITNFYQPGKEMGVTIQVGVSFDSDLERVEQVTLEVARTILAKTPGSVAEFEPLLRFHTLAEYRIEFTVILRAREFADQYLIKHEFIKELHARYRREGIQIPYPTGMVYLGNAMAGNGPTTMDFSNHYQETAGV